MSLPNNNQNQVNSGTDASNPIPATPIASFPPFRHNPTDSAFNSYPYPVGFGIPYQNITPFKRLKITYEYDIDQPAAANHYNLIHSGTATAASFPGLLNGGSRNNSMFHHQNALAFESFGPRAHSAPFVGARVSYNYEGPRIVVPRYASSSVSLRERRRPRGEPQVQITNDHAAGTSQSVQMNGIVAGENTRGRHECPECGRIFKSGPALGGHMSHHARRRREEQERRIAETDS